MNNMQRAIYILFLCIICTHSGDLKITGDDFVKMSIQQSWNNFMSKTKYSIGITIINDGSNHEELYRIVDKSELQDIRFVIDVESRKVAYSTNMSKSVDCRKRLVKDIMDKNTEGSIIERFKRLLQNLDILVEKCPKKNCSSRYSHRDGNIVCFKNDCDDEIHCLGTVSSFLFTAFQMSFGIFVCIVILWCLFSSEESKIYNSSNRNIMVRDDSLYD